MNLRNVLSIVVKELIHLRRDPMTVALTLFLPIFAISVVNFGFGGVVDVPLVVSDQDGNGQAQRIVDAFRHVETFEIVLEGNITEVDARQLVYDGFAEVVVVIPKGTSDAVVRNQRANLTVMIDATDQTIYQSIRGGLAVALRDATTGIMREKIRQIGTGAEPEPIDFIEVLVYGQDLRVVDSILPAVIVFMQSYISMSLTSMSVIKEKLGRTLERILTAPVKGSEILLGKLIGSVIIALAAMILLLMTGFWIFGIKMAGSIIDVFLLVFLIILGGLGLGLATSAVAKREVEAVMMIGAYITPSLLMSGFLWPIEAMSPMLRNLAYLVPMTYANHALKTVMLSGRGFSVLSIDILALTVFAAGTMALGTLMFRRELVAQT